MSLNIMRRRLLQTSGLATGLAMLEFTGLGRLALASSTGENRLLVVVLRGAMDGLAAVVPYGDSAYADARGAIAMPQNGDDLIRLDSFFALPNALQSLAPLYQQKQLTILHAASTPYRERSHFDAQDCLENGSNTAHGMNTGWLNRSLASLQTSRNAIAVGPSIPLVLRGSSPVNSWAPSVLPNVDDDFLMRVMSMYDADAQLQKSLAQAQEMNGMNESMTNALNNKAFIGLMQKAAQFMLGNTSARIGTVELGGWDTHSNQGLTTGRLASNLKLLADGLIAFQQAMGAQWKQTAVLVVTEFGRTVKVNGSKGTDHGTGGVAFLLGGGLNGGQVIGDWPGLNKLYEDRDLIPTNDLRSLFKSVLQQHMGVDSNHLEQSIFPDSKAAKPFSNLFLQT